MTSSSLPDSDILTSAIEKIQSTGILVIGDVMLDRYVTGDVTRISPEAPIPVLRQRKDNCVPGGAANVARNLAHLGCAVNLIGAIGEDEQAELLIDALSFLPQFTFHPIISEAKPTTTKTRFMASNQQLLRLDTEDTSAITAKQAEHITALASQMINSTKIIILSDYAKGCLTTGLIKDIISLADRHNVPVIIDPKSADLSIYAGADMLTPNLKEIQIAAGEAITSIAEIEQFARNILTAHNIGAMLVTLGARGMVLVTGKTSHQISAHASDVFDVSGAGDTVIAYMAAMLATAHDNLDAAKVGNLAASLVVSKLGTASLCPGELLATHTHGYNVPSADVVQSQISDWQKQGLTIGFTNGCFDLIHPGHIELLQQAAASCDRLVVGLNSDASVKQLKGAHRPVQPQSVRQAILASLTSVDAVITFDEDTPLKLIKQLKPDLLVKGGDYQAEDVVGFDEVTSSGGSVTIIPLLDRYSTTSFLASHQLG